MCYLLAPQGSTGTFMCDAEGPMEVMIEALCDGIANCSSGEDERSTLCQSEFLHFRFQEMYNL